MTYFKKILLAAALLLAAASTDAQIISSWSDTLSLPGHRDNGLVSSVGDDRNASTSQFLDWEYTLGDFADIKTVTEQELTERMARQAAVERRKMMLDGILKDVPSAVDENGIDLYLLTEEGIHLYMQALNPSFVQEITPETVKWIRYYAYHKRQKTATMFSRFERWEPHIHNCFSHYGVPTDIATLCLIESACTYTALSKAGALGMWQLMPATARQYGMTVSQDTDERRDPVLSTETAAKLLAANHEKTQDWTLAIAAYNCGPGRISTARSKALSNSWAAINRYLPKETQAYIPSLLAITYVWSYRRQLAL